MLHPSEQGHEMPNGHREKERGWAENEHQYSKGQEVHKALMREPIGCDVLKAIRPPLADDRQARSGGTGPEENDRTYSATKFLTRPAATA
ncbi:hypothetical protein Y695_03185 [Hydrogenophaga sp. T4]|nr:hypothetical protein Y695_03185 [Hydrogenophaga sp. T4]